MNSKALVAALSVSACFAGSASAVVLVSETFSYPDGNITDQAAWSSFDGSTSFVQIASGEAVVTHGGGSREDVTTTFTDLTTGTVYAGFDFSVDDLGAPYSGTDAEYFAHFEAGTFVGRVDIGAPASTGDFSVGLATFSGTADVLFPTDLSFDVVYRAVVAYDIDEDQATLWIDPVSEASTSVVGADGTASLTVSGFNLRQSNSSEDESVRVDNLVIATSFDEALVIPEPASVGLFIAGGLLVARRRRRTA